MRAFSLIAVLAFVATACGGGDGEKVCREAATKYTTCIGEVLGPEAAKMTEGKGDEGIKACAKDSKTQAMYKECLPTADCEGFLKCMEDYAMRTAPK